MRNKFALKINKYFYYGWIVLLMSALSTFFSSPGQTYSISAYINSYVLDFDYSRTMLSTLYTFATLLSGALIIFMGKAVDRFGQRRMLVISGLMLSIACLFNSFIVNTVMIFVGFFLLRFFGQGSLTLVPGALIPQWFDKNRALSLSLMAYGNMIGNMIAPTINTFMITHYSWQVAWRGWSVLLLFIFVPLVSFFIINKPEDIGLLQDNQKAKDQKEIHAELKKMAQESFHLNEAIKTKSFWFIGAISMLTPLISTGMMFHFFSIMKTKNVDPTMTAIVIGLVAIPGFFMPIVASAVIDRYRSRHILTITSILIGLDLIYMLFVHNFMMACIFILIYGLISNVQNLTINVIWVKYFGRLHLGSIRGAATVFTVVGSAFGTIPFGLSFDLTGGYVPAFIAMACLSIMGAMMSIFIRKPSKSL
ncbi:MFS transporter [Fusibacter sp. 3D3]|uniref:MFS transporter n=1 Tax=Fusibacter sp. 3D3 TaxID=1048380 RepID=UPI000B01EED2|nr:MFS transporter [Fusibacter sp. 3D3]